MTLESFVNNIIGDSLGFAFPDVILIMALAISIIGFALGLRSGLILLWCFLGLLYMGFYTMGIDTFHVLTLFILVGVIMVVSLFTSHSHEKSGVAGL